MIPWIILGALAIGTVVVVACWDDIVDWLSDFLPKVRNFWRTVKQKVAHAAGMFLQKIKDAKAKIMHKMYYKEHGQWVEETTTRKIDESELPPSIKRKLSFSEEDITDEIEDELHLEV